MAEGGRTPDALALLHSIWEEGYSAYDIVGMFARILVTLEGAMPQEKLFEMMRCVAELKKRVLEGLTTEIQLGQFVAKCASL